MWTTMESPVGELRIVEQAGELTAIEFSPFPQTSGLSPRGSRSDEEPVLVEAVRQLREYFRRERRDFDLPLASRGSPFQRSVWAQLVEIAYGETASYGEIAARLGRSNVASRAVGLANGRNPLPIVVPCHRVIGADGTLTGYAGGLDRKRILLQLEQDSLF